MKYAIVSVAAFVLLAGCASVTPQAGFPDVQKTVSERTGKDVRWLTGTAEDKAARDAVDRLLENQLSVDAAVQIALLNNPSLQASYEELGVAQADLVQAGLLGNPVFSAQARVPSGPGGINTEFSIVQSFLDILLLPARERIAAAQFEEAKLRVTNDVLAFAAQVRAAGFTLQAAQNRAAVLREITAAAEGSFALAKRLNEAGNASDLFVANQQAIYEQARVELAQSEADVSAARERMNTLMGLWGAKTEWRMAQQLPALPEQEVSLDHLESLAVAQRLDLAALRKRVETGTAALNLTQDLRWVGSVDVGVDTERNTDGTRLTGPSVSFDLPVFDQRQAKIAKAQAELRRSGQRYQGLAIAIRSEVRAARDRLVNARDLAVHYRDVVIPLQKRLVTLTQQQYNFMLTGAFDLLLAKQNEIRTYRDYLDAVRDYWIARSDLELAVGGSLAGNRPPGS